MPQDDGGSIPFDISVTACITSVYDHILLLMKDFGIELMDTKFSYSVKYGGEVYAHDFDSALRKELQPEIDRFQKLLRRVGRFGGLTRSRSKFLNALNPYNYVGMGTLLNRGGFSGDFRYKVLKPMFVNFLMATNVFDIAGIALLPVSRVLRHRTGDRRCRRGIRERGASTSIFRRAFGTGST